MMGAGFSKVGKTKWAGGSHGGVEKGWMSWEDWKNLGLRRKDWEDMGEEKERNLWLLPSD